LVISVFKQVFNPEIVQQLGSAIPASMGIMFGMSLGFVATYQIAAERVPLGNEFRRDV
jgi:tetrahydromethanopterin S-methyltransferase subunit G